MQKEGIDCEDTYSPITVLGWSSRKVDYVQAFPQAKLADKDTVYMNIPAGYHVGDNTTGENMS